MEAILTEVIVEKILDYLDKESLFVFFRVCKIFNNFKYYVYNRLKFDYNLIKNEPNTYKSCVKYLCNMTEKDIIEAVLIFPNLVGCYRVLYDPNDVIEQNIAKFIVSLDVQTPMINKDMKSYTHLKEIIIDNELFNDTLKNIPQSVTNLKIKSLVYNKEVNHLTSIKSLVIESSSFNQTVPDKLLANLEELVINSPTYTKHFPSKFPKHKMFSLMFGSAISGCSSPYDNIELSEPHNIGIFVN
ncbi:putative orfan [Tupanvirus soda lake]|uniref:Orfan n=1 Tax=Tupanvirus deep ocean TaxID=2126984 RepID=A0A2K9L504_9VIRU|nr:putative orfan [Tupanvirus soda lake]AUL77498.2 putative orfan [Tupanvirus soda lake]